MYPSLTKLASSYSYDRPLAIEGKIPKERVQFTLNLVQGRILKACHTGRLGG